MSFEQGQVGKKIYIIVIVPLPARMAGVGILFLFASCVGWLVGWFVRSFVRSFVCSFRNTGYDLADVLPKLIGSFLAIPSVMTNDIASYKSEEQ